MLPDAYAAVKQQVCSHQGNRILSREDLEQVAIVRGLLPWPEHLLFHMFAICLTTAKFWSALPVLTPAPVLIEGHVQDPMQAVLGPRSQFRHLTDPHTCAPVSHMPTTDALSALSAYSAVGPSPYLSAPLSHKCLAKSRRPAMKSP